MIHLIFLALYLSVAVVIFCFLAWDSGRCDSSKILESRESGDSDEPYIAAMISLFWILALPLSGVAWLIQSCIDGVERLYQRFYDAGRDKGVGK